MATRTARGDVYPTSRAKYVTRARGQASRSLINRELPHRVLMRAEDVRGQALDAVYAFHDNRGVPVRCHSLRKDDEWYSVYCFTGRGMAEGFHLLFGGQLVNALKPR